MTQYTTSNSSQLDLNNQLSGKNISNLKYAQGRDGVWREDSMSAYVASVDSALATSQSTQAPIPIGSPLHQSVEHIVWMILENFFSRYANTGSMCMDGAWRNDLQLKSNISMNNHHIKDVPYPFDDEHAANKLYVDTLLAQLEERLKREIIEDKGSTILRARVKNFSLLE